MKKIYRFFCDYYTKDNEIDVTLFKVLGTAGVLVSVLAAIQSFAVESVGGIINTVAAVLSVLLLWFVDKTGHYLIGYISTRIIRILLNRIVKKLWDSHLAGPVLTLFEYIIAEFRFFCPVGIVRMKLERKIQRRILNYGLQD